MEYGEYLKAMRKDRGLSQKGAAELIGISAQYLSELERGGRKSLDDEKNEKIAEVFGLLESQRETLMRLSHEKEKKEDIPKETLDFLKRNPDVIIEIDKAIKYGMKLKAV